LAKEIAKFKIPERLEILPDFPLSTFGRSRRRSCGDDVVRIIDLTATPTPKEWIACQQPYVDALAKYWIVPGRRRRKPTWCRNSPAGGVEAVLVALDLETTIGTPPCSNDYVSRSERHRRDHPFVGRGRSLQR